MNIFSSLIFKMTVSYKVRGISNFENPCPNRRDVLNLNKLQCE